MAKLTTIFELVDNISDKLDRISNSGNTAVDDWERVSTVADSAVNSSVEAVESVSGALDNYIGQIKETAANTDYWTNAIGNYSKAAMEEIYTTEELVEAGYKTAEALEYEDEIIEACSRAAGELSETIENVSQAQEEYTSILDDANGVLDDIAENEKVSVETKEELQEATSRAAEAYANLEDAQREAQAAMENYDAVMIDEKSSLDEIENAAMRAASAADSLRAADEAVISATESVAEATSKAADEAEKASKSGIGAIEAVSGALAAAGITAVVKETTDAVYGLAEAFSEASNIVVLATGATGDTLDGLNESMMKVYATSRTGNLNETAGAVGEINTRLGYTDEILEETTGLFIDFAAVTGGNAARSVRSVTQLMNQWNVDAENMEVVLSKLTYAGQASGISVDTLSSQLINHKAILDQLGFSLDEAIAMFMNFELQGTNTAQVMTGLRMALSKGVIGSLDELYAVLEQIADGTIDTAEAADMFGSRAGPAIVNAAKGGVFALDDLTEALGKSSGLLETTAETAQTLDQKWQQASKNISSAFTTAVQPTIDSISSGMAEIANGVGDFLNEHPVITKALTAIGVGLGVVTVGIAGTAAVLVASIPQVAAFGVALNTALGPIGWISLGLTAIAAAGTAFIAMVNDADDVTEGMTATTRAQYEELQNLNTEYENACDKYGETSEEALRLRYQIDETTTSFESNRKTVEELTAEVDNLCDKIDETTDGFYKEYNEISSQETGTLALIQRYEDLASQTQRTSEQQVEFEAVTNRLSETFPDLSEKLNSGAISAEEYANAVKAATEQNAKYAKQQAAQKAMTDAMQEQIEVEAKIKELEANIAAEREAHGLKFSEYTGTYTNFWYNEGGLISDCMTDMDEYQDALEEAKQRQEELSNTIDYITESEARATEEAQRAADGAKNYGEAVSAGYGLVKDEVDKLCESYNEAYIKAQESFIGQFGLFDTAKADIESTVASAQTALDSQLAYWEAYSSNVEILKNTTAEDLGLVSDEYGTAQEKYDALMTKLQDGSTEAAGLAKSIVDNINTGNTEAVTKLAETNAKVAEARDKAAGAVADWTSGLTTKLDEIQDTMDNAVDKMNLSEEAKKNAKSTLDGYINQLQNQKEDVVVKATEIAEAAANALESKNPTVTINVKKNYIDDGEDAINNALGGIYDSPTLTWVAEAGDSEAIIPLNETPRAFDLWQEAGIAIGAIKTGTPYIDTGDIGKSEEVNYNTTAEKNIVLKLEGGGEIKIPKTLSKQEVLDLLVNNAKPILLKIIEQELFEEGDVALAI